MDWSIVSKILLPEFIVVASIILTILLSLFEKTKKYVSAVATVALALASIIASQTGYPDEAKKILNSAFISDTLCIYLRVLIYGVAALIAMCSTKYLDKYESPAEYYPIFYQQL